MWDEVRRELMHLEWDAEAPAAVDGLLPDWSATLTALLAIRRGLAPITAHDDPFAVLAVATGGAVRAGAWTAPDPAPSLERVRQALNRGAFAITPVPPNETDRHLAGVTRAAYELTHWVGIHTANDQARQWLLVGETALDGALHAPTPRTATGAGIAAWQAALAAVQHQQHVPVLRRGVALGHSTILHTALRDFEDATRSGALPGEFGRSVVTSIRQLERAHQATMDALGLLPRGSSPADRVIMLQLGEAVRQLAGIPDSHEDADARLDALLRSGIGHSALVTALTRDPDARRPAERLQRLALEYLAHPDMLRRDTRHHQPPPATRAPRTQSSPARAPEPTSPIRATIAPGTLLDADTVAALCRTRDIGTAASTANPGNPPPILHGTDPANWPQLATAGQEAVADLVAAVTPMVYASASGLSNRDDACSEMFLHLLKAAHSFDPDRPGMTWWPSYAWQTLQHVRWRGVDVAGVPNGRGTQPPKMVTLAGTDPKSLNHNPQDIIEAQTGFEKITRAVDALPDNLREPLKRVIAGQSTHSTAAELGLATRTVQRRITKAREILRQELDGVGDNREHSSRVPTETARPRDGVSTWETAPPLPRQSDQPPGPTPTGPTPTIGW